MGESKEVSYLAFESVQVRLERMNRRLWILCLMLILMLVGTNAGWLYYESQFEDTSVEQEIDTGDGDSVVIGVGDYHGED